MVEVVADGDSGTVVAAVRHHPAERNVSLHVGQKAGRVKNASSPLPRHQVALPH